jgi:two-component system nitrate/nitrite response regulator NarL
MEQQPRTVIFAGYNRLFEEGMKLLLGARYIILKYTKSFDSSLAVMQADDLQIDLLIGDPGSDTQTELDAILAISRQFPDTKIVVLASQIDQLMLDAAVKNGVGGVLSSDISVTAMLYSIELVLLGEQIVPTILSSADRKSIQSNAPVPSPAADSSELGASLSDRERQILQCLAIGLPNKAIARNLDLSEATVKVHIKMLLRKLRMQNRTQAAIWGINHGFRATVDPHHTTFGAKQNSTAEGLLSA